VDPVSVTALTPPGTATSPELHFFRKKLERNQSPDKQNLKDNYYDLCGTERHFFH
jgi:hypothetical protein